MPIPPSFATDVRELSPAQAQIRVAGFIRRVYGWMFFGLLVTAGTAAAVVSSKALLTLFFGSRWVFWVLVLAELGLVIYLSARALKMSAAAATMAFTAYAGLNGITLSPLLLVYTGASVANAFVACAGMFGLLALWGTVTKKDLTSWGHFFGMGLFGVILAGVVSIFWPNPGLTFAISLVTVAVFVGLTAYDAQKLKAIALAVPGEPTVGVAVGGALSLYLDFINLFLAVLRLFGRER